MGRFVSVEFVGGTAVIEVDEDAAGDIELLSSDERWQKFEDAVDAIKRGGGYLLEQVKSLKPSEMELTCGFKVGAEGGNTTWGFAKTSGEASLSVKLKWSIDKME